MTRIAGLVAMMIMVLLPAAAQAQRCTVTATGVNFGVYQPFASTANLASGGVTVKCVAYTGSYTIALSPGSSGTFANRSMSSGGYTLSYQLFTTPARSTVWGDGSNGTATIQAFCPLTCDTPYAVYGTLPARQVATPGSYTDTIAVTVTY